MHNYGKTAALGTLSQPTDILDILTTTTPKVDFWVMFFFGINDLPIPVNIVTKTHF